MIYNPDGSPHYIRAYDDGGATADRYTVVFTGRYRHKTCREYITLGMSAYPYHPQGVGMHAFSKVPMDRPKSAHLGKRIPWDRLPEDCQRCVLDTYGDLWGRVEK